MQTSEESYGIDVYGRNDVGAETRIEHKEWSFTKQPARTVKFRFVSIRNDAYEVRVPSDYLRGLHRSLLDPEIELFNLIDFVDNSFEYRRNPKYVGKVLKIPVIFEFRPGEFLFEHKGSSYRVRFYPLQERRRGSVVRKVYRRAAERPDPTLPAGHEENRTTKRLSMQLDYDVLKILDEKKRQTGFDRTKVISMCAVAAFDSELDAVSNELSLSGHTKLVQIRLEPNIAERLKASAKKRGISMTNWITDAVIMYAKEIPTQDVELNRKKLEYDQ